MKIVFRRFNCFLLGFLVTFQLLLCHTNAYSLSESYENFANGNDLQNRNPDSSESSDEPPTGSYEIDRIHPSPTAFTPTTMFVTATPYGLSRGSQEANENETSGLGFDSSATMTPEGSSSTIPSSSSHVLDHLLTTASLPLHTSYMDVAESRTDETVKESLIPPQTTRESIARDDVFLTLRTPTEISQSLENNEGEDRPTSSPTSTPRQEEEEEEEEEAVLVKEPIPTPMALISSNGEGSNPPLEEEFAEAFKKVGPNGRRRRVRPGGHSGKKRLKMRVRKAKHGSDDESKTTLPTNDTSGVAESDKPRRYRSTTPTPSQLSSSPLIAQPSATSVTVVKNGPKPLIITDVHSGSTGINAVPQDPQLEKPGSGGYTEKISTYFFTPPPRISTTLTPVQFNTNQTDSASAATTTTEGIRAQESKVHTSKLSIRGHPWDRAEVGSGDDLSNNSVVVVTPTSDTENHSGIRSVLPTPIIRDDRRYHHNHHHHHRQQQQPEAPTRSPNDDERGADYDQGLVDVNNFNSSPNHQDNRKFPHSESEYNGGIGNNEGNPLGQHPGHAFFSNNPPFSRFEDNPSFPSTTTEDMENHHHPKSHYDKSKDPFFATNQFFKARDPFPTDSSGGMGGGGGEIPDPYNNSPSLENPPPSTMSAPTHEDEQLQPPLFDRNEYGSTLSPVGEQYYTFPGVYSADSENQQSNPQLNDYYTNPDFKGSPVDPVVNGERGFYNTQLQRPSPLKGGPSFGYENSLNYPQGQQANNNGYPDFPNIGDNNEMPHYQRQVGQHHQQGEGGPSDQQPNSDGSLASPLQYQYQQTEGSLPDFNGYTGGQQELPVYQQNGQILSNYSHDSLYPNQLQNPGLQQEGPPFNAPPMNAPENGPSTGLPHQDVVVFMPQPPVPSPPLGEGPNGRALYYQPMSGGPQFGLPLPLGQRSPPPPPHFFRNHAPPSQANGPYPLMRPFGQNGSNRFPQPNTPRYTIANPLAALLDGGGRHSHPEFRNPHHPMNLQMQGLDTNIPPPPSSQQQALSEVQPMHHFPLHAHSMSEKPDYEPANPPLPMGHENEVNFGQFDLNPNGGGEPPQAPFGFQNGNSYDEQVMDQEQRNSIPMPTPPSHEDRPGFDVVSAYFDKPPPTMGTDFERGQQGPSSQGFDDNELSKAPFQFSNADGGGLDPNSPFSQNGYSDEKKHSFLDGDAYDSNSNGYNKNGLNKERQKTDEKNLTAMYSETPYVLMFPRLIPEEAMIPPPPKILTKEIPVVQASSLSTMKFTPEGKPVLGPGLKAVPVHPRHQMYQVLAKAHYDKALQRYMEGRKKPPSTIYTPYGILVPMGPSTAAASQNYENYAKILPASSKSKAFSHYYKEPTERQLLRLLLGKKSTLGHVHLYKTTSIRNGKLKKHVDFKANVDPALDILAEKLALKLSAAKHLLATSFKHTASYSEPQPSVHSPSNEEVKKFNSLSLGSELQDILASSSILEKTEAKRLKGEDAVDPSLKAQLKVMLKERLVEILEDADRNEREKEHLASMASSVVATKLPYPSAASQAASKWSQYFSQPSSGLFGTIKRLFFGGPSTSPERSDTDAGSGVHPFGTSSYSVGRMGLPASSASPPRPEKQSVSVKRTETTANSESMNLGVKKQLEKWLDMVMKSSDLATSESSIHSVFVKPPSQLQQQRKIERRMLDLHNSPKEAALLSQSTTQKSSSILVPNFSLGQIASNKASSISNSLLRSNWNPMVSSALRSVFQYPSTRGVHQTVETSKT